MKIVDAVLTIPDGDADAEAAAFGQLPVFGAETTSGTLDWNDASNLTTPYGPVLLQGSATNGPGGSAFFHVVNIPYGAIPDNITQYAVPYSVTPLAGTWVRGKAASVWSAWTRIDAGAITFGATTTSGTLDWNDVSNSEVEPYGPVLLTGDATNGPGGSGFFHCENVIYEAASAITQYARPYANNIAGGHWVRGRISAVWSAWQRIDDHPDTVQSVTTNDTYDGDAVLVLVDASGGNRTLTLTTAASSTKPVTVKKADASTNTVTIEGDGSETIDGALNQVITTQYESLSVMSNLTAWWIM